MLGILFVRFCTLCSALVFVGLDSSDWFGDVFAYTSMQPSTVFIAQSARGMFTINFPTRCSIRKCLTLFFTI